MEVKVFNIPAPVRGQNHERDTAGTTWPWHRQRLQARGFARSLGSPPDGRTAFQKISLKQIYPVLPTTSSKRPHQYTEILGIGEDVKRAQITHGSRQPSAVLGRQVLETCFRLIRDHA